MLTIKIYKETISNPNSIYNDGCTSLSLISHEGSSNGRDTVTTELYDKCLVINPERWEVATNKLGEPAIFSTIYPGKSIQLGIYKDINFNNLPEGMRLSVNSELGDKAVSIESLV